MKLLALDPSSTVIGYALMSCPSKLLESGRLRCKGHVPVLRRITLLMDDVTALLNDKQPDTIVVEVSSGHKARRIHHIKGLQTYGMGISSALVACRQWAQKRNGEAARKIIQEGRKRSGGTAKRGVEIWAAKENDWTKGRSKRDRALGIACAFREFSWDFDTGMDAADAVGLALWWFAQRKFELPAGEKVET